jgi:hypothetical protein
MNQNWDFWSENKPSGNPGYQAAVIKLQKPGKANSGQGRQWQPKSETKKHLFSRKRARQTLKKVSDEEKNGENLDAFRVF